MYGPKYRDSLESLYGDGFRLAEDLGDSNLWGPPGATRDGDLTATAMLLENRLGVPLQKSLGPNGPLGKLLSKPADFSKISPLQTAALHEDDLEALLKVSSKDWTFGELDAVIEGMK